MPSLGADMDAGTLRAWRVEVGDRVKRGQIVGEVETEKGIIDLEIWEDGVVEALLVPPGTKVPVGTPLARVSAATSAPGPAPAVAPARALAPPAASAPAPVASAAAAATAAAPTSRAAARRGALVTPAARLLARELGIDPADLPGTGPHGAVTRADVERAAPNARDAATAIATAPAAAVVAPVGSAAPPASDADARRAAMRRAIAAAMARSKREIPHYYLFTTADMSRTLAWIEAKNRDRPPAERILPAAVTLRAVARSLRDVPELNGFFMDGEFHGSEHVHLGVAIALRGGGLVAPAIHDAERKSVDEIMRDLRDLVQRARTGGLRSSEMADPTITVTNLGDQGVESVFGVIYPPQVALVGVGRITERPWAKDGLLGVRPTVVLSLAADHRASDGHRGGRFLSAVAARLEDPDKE
jgi:pyruvate dehydrogenase E2 component (dihydrolipoamide acetyltransferase)